MSQQAALQILVLTMVDFDSKKHGVDDYRRIVCNVNVKAKPTLSCPFVSHPSNSGIG